jgi:hypothetical protein
VFFRYDPDFVERPTALVFLTDGGKIEAKWLVHEDQSPPECATIRSVVVDLTGYYDAGWCCTTWPRMPEIPFRNRRGRRTRG